MKFKYEIHEVKFIEIEAESEIDGWKEIDENLTDYAFDLDISYSYVERGKQLKEMKK